MAEDLSKIHGRWTVYRDGGLWDGMTGYGYPWAMATAEWLAAPSWVKECSVRVIPSDGSGERSLTVAAKQPAWKAAHLVREGDHIFLSWNVYARVEAVEIVCGVLDDVKVWYGSREPMTYGARERVPMAYPEPGEE